MPTFLVELYLPRRGSVVDVARRARLAAAYMQRGGSAVSYVRSTHLAEEETCFVAFEAPSPEAVVEAACAAGWANARVIEAVEAGGAASTPSPGSVRGRRGSKA